MPPSPALAQLLEIALLFPKFEEVDWPDGICCPEILAPLFHSSDGFLAFEGALWSFSSQTLAEVNQGAWRSAYAKLPLEAPAFATDALENLFLAFDTGIVLLNGETGELENVAETLEQWASAVLTEDYWSGASLCAAWVGRNGPLPPKTRLAPRLPFVLGGLYEPTELVAVPLLERLGFNAYLHRQICDLPDGSAVELNTF